MWQIPLFIVHIKVVEQILIGSCYWAIGPIYNFLPLWNTSPITIIIVWTRKEKNLLLTFRLKTECNLNILNYLSTFHHSKPPGHLSTKRCFKLNFFFALNESERKKRVSGLFSFSQVGAKYNYVSCLKIIIHRTAAIISSPDFI